VTSSRRGDLVEGLLLDLVLLLIGGLLGVIGCFLVPLRLGGGGIEGLAIGVALIGNFGTGLLGGLGNRSVRSALAPGLGWFLAVGAISSLAPGGDVIIPGKLPVDPGVVTVGEAFLILGVAGAIGALAVTAFYTRRPDAPTHSE
jgi:hypothetical protein